MQGKIIPLLILFQLSAVFAAAQTASPMEAVVVEVRGTVELRPPPTGQAEWIPAVPGARVEAGTIISTGFRSSALIQAGSSRIELRPLTRLSLEEIVQREGGEEIQLTLQIGRIRTNVAPPAGRSTDFTVRSPIAVASVRGTSFEFDTVNLRVDTGLIHYSFINGLAVYVAGREASYAEELSRRIVSPMEIIAGSRIPHIPQYTGIDESGVSPRLPVTGDSPGGDDGGEEKGGIILQPRWTHLQN